MMKVKRGVWPKHALVCNGQVVKHSAVPNKGMVSKWFDPKTHGRAAWFLCKGRHVQKQVWGKLKFARRHEAEMFVEALLDILVHRDFPVGPAIHNKIANLPWVEPENVLIVVD